MIDPQPALRAVRSQFDGLDLEEPPSALQPEGRVLLVVVDVLVVGQARVVGIAGVAACTSVVTVAPAVQK